MGLVGGCAIELLVCFRGSIVAVTFGGLVLD